MALEHNSCRWSCLFRSLLPWNIALSMFWCEARRFWQFPVYLFISFPHTTTKLIMLLLLHSIPVHYELEGKELSKAFFRLLLFLMRRHANSRPFGLHLIRTKISSIFILYYLYDCALCLAFFPPWETMLQPVRCHVQPVRLPFDQKPEAGVIRGQLRHETLS